MNSLYNLIPWVLLGCALAMPHYEELYRGPEPRVVGSTVMPDGYAIDLSVTPSGGYEVTLCGTNKYGEKFCETSSIEEVY